MFDLRYHVASLAAVFFALVIGILVGVALASHGLGNTERDRLQEDLRRAENRNDALNAQVDALVQSGADDRAFVDSTYKAVMADRLRGKRIAVLFVGSVNRKLQLEITRALSDANGGAPLRIHAVQVPVNEAALSKRLANRPSLAAYAGDDKLKVLGHDLGQEFTAGTEWPLWKALQNLIVEEATPRVGASKRPADGVVLVRTADPQMGPTALFIRGLYSGLGDGGVPAVGVEATGGGDSAIKAFQSEGLSTVNDIDTPIGKLALVILLSDPAVTGDFGAPPADKPLPKVVPLTTTTGG
jgi:hypothetical protein